MEKPDVATLVVQLYDLTRRARARSDVLEKFAVCMLSELKGSPELRARAVAALGRTRDQLARETQEAADVRPPSVDAEALQLLDELRRAVDG